MFHQLKETVKCCLSHISHIPPDSLNNQFVLLDCKNCKDKNFCLKIKRVIEEELNTRHYVETLLNKQGQ
jgi:hypothetical protein